LSDGVDELGVIGERKEEIKVVAQHTKKKDIADPPV
jgi:hypothetical protein